MSNEADWVLDPFVGTGTSIIAAFRHGRRGAGAEIEPKYIDIARGRIQAAFDGTLKVRPMIKPNYEPSAAPKLTTSPWLPTQEFQPSNLNIEVPHEDR